MDKQTYRKRFFNKLSFSSIVKVTFYIEDVSGVITKKCVLGDLLNAFVEFEEAGYFFEEEFHYKQTPWFIEMSFLKTTKHFLFSSAVTERINVVVETDV